MFSFSYTCLFIPKTRLFLRLLLLFILITKSSYSVNYYTRASGNWSVASNWSTVSCGGAAAATTPGAGDVAFICAGYNIGVNVNTTVASINIQNGGVLQTGTSLLGANKTLTITGTFVIANGGTYIHNNTQVASTTVFAGTESFAAASIFQVNDWSGIADMLITGCNSNFGHLNLNWDSGLSWWNNNGLGYTRTIAGTLTVSSSCATYLDNTAGNKTFTIGAITLNDGWLRFKQTGTGNLLINIAGAISLTNASSLLYVMYGVNGDATLNAASVSQAGGTFYGIYGGLGNISFNITGAWLHSNGVFNGIYNLISHWAGLPNYTVGSMIFNGGIFYANNSFDTLPETMTYLNYGNLEINYNQPGSIFMFNKVGMLDSSYPRSGLNVTINGNFNIGGTYNGVFCSNLAKGPETHIIHGDFNVANGINSFNGYPDSLSTGNHNTNITVDGSVNISGGTLTFSESNNILSVQISGPYLQTNGQVTIKRSEGNSTLNFGSDFTVAGGEFYFFRYSIQFSLFDLITVNVNGNFTHTDGLIEFDNSPAFFVFPKIYRLNLLGSQCNLGPAGQILCTCPTTNSAEINYAHSPGITTFGRSGSHNIQGVDQLVFNVTEINVVSGGMQVSSDSTPGGGYKLTCGNGSIVNLNGFSIFSNSLLPYSGVRVYPNARIRTSHPGGFYNGSASAAIDATGNMNFILDSLSTVEYTGTVNQQITGINVGLASLTQHKYGNLEINHTGPAGTWAYPTSSPSPAGNVIVRNKLILTSGELNFANASGSPASGGRTIHLTNPSPASLQRTGGYIRSEAQDNSGRLDWTINSVAGTYTIPWGVSSSEYIPLTYQLTGGNAGIVSFSTYRTAPDNLPWPSGVTNLASNTGLSPDNRTATVDRFWRMSNTGGSPALNLTFNYTATEVPGIPFNNPSMLRAQAYNGALNNWKAATPGQTASAYQVVAPGVGGDANWTLSSNASPLPVEWLYVKAQPASQSSVNVKWATASETDCDYFTVWKIENNGDQKAIGNVKGHGNSSQISEYNLVDEHPSQGVNFYRVSETDYNGITEWSDIASAAFSQTLPLVCWYQMEEGRLFLQRTSDEVAVLTIIDLSGRLLLKMDLKEKVAECSVSNLSPEQVVFVVVTNRNGEQVSMKVLL